MPLLEVRNLVCGYDGREVLRGISFGIERGEFLCVIGPNGSGKTTLVRAITKVVKPTGGAVIYAGRDVRTIPPIELAREVAVLPQVLDVAFGFTVEEFVSLGRFPHTGRFGRMTPRDMEVVARSMRIADVSHLRERRMTDMSGGERQRALLAQALAQEPRLLLLDEPTAHLDIAHQVEILDVIKRLNRDEGLTVLMVQHDLNLAGEYAERLIMLSDGKVFREGTPEEVLTYEHIEQVYKTVVIVRESPVSGRPHVYLVPKDVRRIAERSR